MRACGSGDGSRGPWDVPLSSLVEGKDAPGTVAPRRALFFDDRGDDVAVGLAISGGRIR